MRKQESYEAMSRRLPTLDLTEFAESEFFAELEVSAQQGCLPAPEAETAVEPVLAESPARAEQVFARGALHGARYNFRPALREFATAHFYARHRSRAGGRRLYFDFYYFRSLESPFCRPRRHKYFNN